MSAGIYRSKLAIATPASFLKAALDTTHLWSKAVLSAPFPDLAGDIVRPEGIDWTDHQADPSVDLEHGRHPEVRGMPVAWARDSLSEPGGLYAVEHKALNFGTDDAPDIHTVPIGTSYFDPQCKVSMQCFALVEQDLLPAVSLEFSMVPGFHKSLGRSPLEPRDAMDFGRTRAKRWALTGRGVCPHALTLRKSVRESLTQVPHGFEKLLEDKQVNVGGKWEPLHGVILKALSAYQPPARKSRVIVRVEKSMDEADADLETADETDDTGDEAPAAGGVAAKLRFVQALTEAMTAYQADMQSSDDPALRKAAEADIAKISKDAAKIKARADGRDALLNGGTEPEPDEDDEMPDEEVEKALRHDADGLLGCRPVYKALITPPARHFSLAEAMDAAPAPVKKAPKAPAPEDDPEVKRKCAEVLKLLARNMPNK